MAAVPRGERTGSLQAVAYPNELAAEGACSGFPLLRERSWRAPMTASSPRSSNPSSPGCSRDPRRYASREAPFALGL